MTKCRQNEGHIADPVFFITALLAITFAATSTDTVQEYERMASGTFWLRSRATASPNLCYSLSASALPRRVPRHWYASCSILESCFLGTTTSLHPPPRLLNQHLQVCTQTGTIGRRLPFTHSTVENQLK